MEIVGIIVTLAFLLFLDVLFFITTILSNEPKTIQNGVNLLGYQLVLFAFISIPIFFWKSLLKRESLRSIDQSKNSETLLRREYLKTLFMILYLYFGLLFIVGGFMIWSLITGMQTNRSFYICVILMPVFVRLITPLSLWKDWRKEDGVNGLKEIKKYCQTLFETESNGTNSPYSFCYSRKISCKIMMFLLSELISGNWQCAGLGTMSLFQAWRTLVLPDSQTPIEQNESK